MREDSSRATTSISITTYYLLLLLLLPLPLPLPLLLLATILLILLLDHQDIRQCHFPGDQNRAEDRYEEEAYNPNEEGQHVFQSLSPD